MKDRADEAQRRRALAWATALTANPPLAPQPDEQELFEQYARGEITLDDVLQQLDTRVQHVLYRSQAVAPFSAAQLQALLAQSRAYNEAHGITGLLCYHEGHFVQLLEGEAEPVHRLYTAIRQDARHEQVTTLTDAAGPLRFFPDWRMAYVEVEASKFQWVLSCVGGKSHSTKAPPMPVQDPHLLTLLAAFGDPTKSS